MKSAPILLLALVLGEPSAARSRLLRAVDAIGEGTLVLEKEPIREDIERLPIFSPVTPPTAPPVPAPKVVTLGDSFSSGTGIHRDGSDYDEQYGGNPSYNGVSYKLTVRSDNACWRETDTTPGPMLASSEGKTSIFLACKGAEASHVTNQMNYLNALYPDDAAAHWEGSTILLTAGGNDIRTEDGQDWPSLLERCITEINPFKGCDDHSKNQIDNFPAIKSTLAELFKKIASEASGAKIRVLGYPRIMQRDPGCGSVTGVGRDEADWMDDNVDDLNEVIADAVSNAKSAHSSVDIEFVSVVNYLTVGACGDGPNNRHVHDKRLTSSWGTSDSSFHPSQKGYNAYYSALLTSL